jgi:hypothetical protein
MTWKPHHWQPKGRYGHDVEPISEAIWNPAVPVGSWKGGTTAGGWWEARFRCPECGEESIRLPESEWQYLDRRSG